MVGSLVFAASAAASFPPASDGRIAFDHLVPAEGFDVYTVAPDSSGLLNLSGAEPSSSNPLYTPTGREIVFSKLVTLSPLDIDIWVMKEDGSQARSLTAGMAGTQVATGISPDGRTVAFTSDQGPSFDLWVMNLDGTGATNLTPGIGANQTHGTFSPDGRKIAYATGQAGNADIYAMNVDGSGQAPVITTGASESDPEFSPDGKSIVFQTNRDGGDFEVYKAGADGSNPVNLSNFSAEFDTNPTFSAKGSRIAFTSIRDGDHDIWTMNADGSGQANISNALNGQDTAASWQALPRCGKSRATIVGDDGPDKIKGTKKRDVIVANGGKDKISGRGGNDRICGGKGKDRISGGGGDGDKCVGGKGDDSGSGCEKGKL
jgi:Tol biopolymer transport system component